MLDYKGFCTEFQIKVLENKEWNIAKNNFRFYPDGFVSNGDVEELEFIHNTNLKYHHTENDILIGDYVVIDMEASEITKSSCRFSLEYLFQEFKEDGWAGVWLIVEDNIKMITLANENVDSSLEHINEYKIIKDRLIIRPINFTNNRYELKNNIYERYGDIALVLYIVLYNGVEIGLGTTRVQKNIFDKWDKPLEEVWETALLNANIMSSPRMYMTPEECMNPPFSRGVFMSLTNKPTKIGRYQVPTITTVKQTNGAIAMFYPGVKEKLAELIGGSYYISFTSIHEAKIHYHKSISPHVVLDCLKSVNKAFDPEEILSRKVFYYDCEKDTFKPLDL